MILRHICEVCGAEQNLTPEAAHEAGRDYPPKMGPSGLIGPRTCPNCVVNQTVWRTLVVEKFTADTLTPHQRETIGRIGGEPDSIVLP